MLPLEDVGAPRAAAEDPAFASRRSVPLPQGRPVADTTHKSREREIARFEAWLREGEDGQAAVDTFWAHAAAGETDADSMLQSYGQFLWHAGAPYNRYAMTINAAQARAPPLRGASRLRLIRS